MIWVNRQPVQLSIQGMLRPWIRRFTMIISDWWIQTSSKFRGQKFEDALRNIVPPETPPSSSGFLQTRSSHRNEKCAIIQ